MACTFGLSNTNCYKAWRLVKKYTGNYETCSDCRIVKGLCHIMDNWRSTQEPEKQKTREILRALDIEDTVTKPDHKRDLGFTCPTTNTKVIVPCSLTNCRYHVNYVWTNNCLLSYAMQQERSNLSFEEISFLYQMPVYKVQSLYYDAMHSIKRKMLSDSIDAPHFVYYRTKGICCVCECNIQKYLTRTYQMILPQHLVDDNLGLVYCSNDCLKAKPKRLVELEIEFEVHVKYILKAALYMFKNNVKQVAELLDLSLTVLENACIRYLNRNLASFES